MPVLTNSLRLAEYRSWPVYGGSNDMIHYTRLNEIKPLNVGGLEVAWRYQTNDSFEGSEMQCNPIVEHGVLFATTPKLRVFALDAASGKLLWSFNPNPRTATPLKSRNRGLNYWTDKTSERIFFALREKLFSFDARTGKPDPHFGKNGIIDLQEGLGRSLEAINVSLTTPGVIYKNRFVGSITSEICRQRPAILEPMTCERARSSGRSTLFRTRANPVLKLGRKMHGHTAEPPTIGLACRLMKSAA